MLERRESSHDAHPLTEQMTISWECWAVSEAGSNAWQTYWPTIADSTCDKLHQHMM